MVHASEFHSLFRGATQKRLRNGLRAISHAADYCSRLRRINKNVDDPIALWRLQTHDCKLHGESLQNMLTFSRKVVFIRSEKYAISSSLEDVLRDIL